MGMLPGIAKMKNQIAESNLDDKILKRQVAIIHSMTPKERRHPDLLKASRKRRVAAGSGTKVEEINKLLKMHRGMADMMKAMGGAKRGPIAGLANALGMAAARRDAEPGRDGEARREDAARHAAGMPGGLPKGLPGLPNLPPGTPGLPPGMAGLPPNFGGMPSGLPGLGGSKGPGMPGLGAPKGPALPGIGGAKAPASPGPGGPKGPASPEPAGTKGPVLPGLGGFLGFGKKK